MCVCVCACVCVCMCVCVCVYVCMSLRMIKFNAHAVTQLVETLLYKPAGRGFDSRWCCCVVDTDCFFVVVVFS